MKFAVASEKKVILTSGEELSSSAQQALVSSSFLPCCKLHREIIFHNFVFSLTLRVSGGKVGFLSLREDFTKSKKIVFIFEFIFGHHVSTKQ